MKNLSGDVTIQQADTEDFNLIAVLGAVTFYEAYFEQDDPPDLANYIVESFGPSKVRAEIENPHAIFFIIFLDGKAVGYAKLREDSKAECVSNEAAIELQRIYILERVFSQGIGEMLLKHCLGAAKGKGFETLWLGVWEKNERAQRFYEKHGFRCVGTLTFPYGETVGTNLVLEKVL